MKLRKITQEKRQEFLDEVTSVIENWDDFIRQIDGKLKKYGMLHLNQTQEVIGLRFAKEKKEELVVAMKNLNVSTIDDIISNLKDIKERYINKIAPQNATTDPLELSFIEKEIQVMKEADLLAYYKENYLDKNIVRLCRIEFNRRTNVVGQSIIPMEYVPEDYVTKQIDEQIKFYVGLRQFTGSSCCFIGEIEETGSPVPKYVSWSTILSEVEHRNMQYNINVSLKDFIK